MFWHQTSYLWKPGRAALQAARQTSHCSALLLTEVLCAKKHTEGFSMTQGAKVTYYKWIMRPNAMFWVWTKKGSIHTPLWLGHSGFYFPCTLNGAKQLAEMLYRKGEKLLHSTSERQLQIVTLKRRHCSSQHWRGRQMDQPPSAPAEPFAGN